MTVHRQKFPKIDLLSVAKLAALFIITFPAILRGQECNAFYKYTEDIIWNENKYTLAVDQIKNYMEEQNINVPKVPMQPIYYKAVAYCNSGSFEKGVKNFDWILHNFKLTPSILKEFNKLKKICSFDANIGEYSKVCGTEQLGRRVSYTIELADPEISIQTKSMQSINWRDLDRLEPGTSYLGEAPLQEQLSNTILENRKFNDANISSLRDSITKWGSNNSRMFSIITSRHFGIVLYNDIKSEFYASKLDELENSLEVLVSKYGFTVPENKIIIHVATDKYTMKNIAMKIHGIPINKNLLGYSTDPDQSIVVMAPGLILGTIKHELCHILINYSWGAMAPWLSEGIPAMYEVSDFRNNDLKVLNNWRSEIIDGAMDHHYNISLDSLIRCDWLKFNAQSDSLYNPRRLAVNHAMARYFCFYLLQQNKLKDIVKIYTERDPEIMEESVEENAVKIVENVLGKPINQVQKDFEKWYAINWRKGK